jgi:hypothetical protein
MLCKSELCIGFGQQSYLSWRNNYQAVFRFTFTSTDLIAGQRS